MNRKQKRAIWRGVKDIKTPMPHLDRIQENLDDASGLYWQLAITRKLHQSALRDRRMDDANDYARFLQATSRKARALLK